MAGIKVEGWKVKCQCCDTELQLMRYSSPENPRMYYQCSDPRCRDRHLFNPLAGGPEDLSGKILPYKSEKGGAVKPQSKGIENVAVQTERTGHPAFRNEQSGHRGFSDL